MRNKMNRHIHILNSELPISAIPIVNSAGFKSFPILGRFNDGMVDDIFFVALALLALALFAFDFFAFDLFAFALFVRAVIARGSLQYWRWPSTRRPTTSTRNTRTTVLSHNLFYHNPGNSGNEVKVVPWPHGSLKHGESEWGVTTGSLKRGESETWVVAMGSRNNGESGSE